jgi:DNA-nicking Smr family endonuclease
MKKKTEISEQDQSLFREIMRGVKPLSQTKISIEEQITKPLPKKRPQPKEEITPEDPFSDYETLPPLGQDDLVQFTRGGLQHKTLRNFRNGKYNIEAILDLHGQTVLEARQSLNQFLTSCQQQGKRSVLIIHGKGHHSKIPILKNKLNHWLRQTELVLAFCSATVRDGSGGSLYVLLKGR